MTLILIKNLKLTNLKNQLKAILRGNTIRRVIQNDIVSIMAIAVRAVSDMPRRDFRNSIFVVYAA